MSWVHSYRENVLLGEFRFSMINASGLLPSGDAIKRIVEFVAGVEVRGVAAGFVIAAVQNVAAGWDRAFVQLEREAMRTVELLTMAAERAITAAYRGFSDPRPAFVGPTHVDVSPEALFDCAAFSTHMF
jgi:hypothetical protein